MTTVALLLAVAALLLVGGFLNERRRPRGHHAPPFARMPVSEHPTPPRVPPPKPYKSESNGLTLEEIMALPPRPPEPPDCRVCSHSAGGHLIRKADRGCDVIGCDCTAYEPGAEP